MKRLKVSDILIEGATQLDVGPINLLEQPEVAKLFEKTKETQKEIEKLKEVDEEQLKLVVQL